MGCYLGGAAEVIVVDLLDGLEVDESFQPALVLVWGGTRGETRETIRGFYHPIPSDATPTHTQAPSLVWRCGFNSRIRPMFSGDS